MPSHLCRQQPPGLRRATNIGGAGGKLLMRMHAGGYTVHQAECVSRPLTLI